MKPDKAGVYTKGVFSSSRGEKAMEEYDHTLASCKVHDVLIAHIPRLLDNAAVIIMSDSF